MAEFKSEKKVPPDGGWGYVIVFAFALANIVAIPILQNFGLLFRNVFVELDFSATDVSTIVNVNSAAGMFVGLINGPLLKKFGYRKYAFFGAFLAWIGFFLTSFATQMFEFIIYYGIINSIGINLMIASFSLAMNSYFLLKRSVATGFSSTLTGLGPVFMPLVISKSIEYYSARGTALILSGLLLHGFLAAMLLQPIKWHYKIVKEDEVLEPLKPEDIAKENGAHLTLEMKRLQQEDVDLDQEALDREPSTPSYVMEGMNFPRRISQVEPLGRRDLSTSRVSLYDRNVVIEPDARWWNSKESVNEERKIKRRRTISDGDGKSLKNKLDLRNTINKHKGEYRPQEVEPENEPKTSFCSKIVQMFDLDLLKDPIYVNIWIGMSIAFTGEINFSLLTPVILGDRNFDISQTARIMSTIATADIIFRFISPFIGDYLKLSARKMYMISLIMLVLTRYTLTCVTTYSHTLIVALGLGVAKGFRSVYMTLVIPNQVPLEKLASASGLQTVLNGLILFALGPVVGILRDVFGTFDVVIHLTNILSLVTVFMWAIEMLIVCRLRKSKSSDVTADSSQP